MSDESPTLSERAAKNSLFTVIGHGAASLCLVGILWLGSTVTAMDKRLAELAAEMKAGIVPRIVANERDIQRIEQELAARVRDRFTAADGAALEIRLLREITNLQTEVRRFAEKWEGDE